MMSALAGIWVSLELMASLFERNHLLLTGSISLLHQVAYLDRLTNFSSGNRRRKNPTRRPCKGERHGEGRTHKGIPSPPAKLQSPEATRSNTEASRDGGSS